MENTNILTFVGKDTTIDKEFLQFLAKGEDQVTVTVMSVSKNKVSVSKDNYSTEIELIDGLMYGDKLTISVENSKIVGEELAERVTKSKGKGSTPPFGMKIRY